MEASYSVFNNRPLIVVTTVVIAFHLFLLLFFFFGSERQIKKFPLSSQKFVVQTIHLTTAQPVVTLVKEAPILASTIEKVEEKPLQDPPKPQLNDISPPTPVPEPVHVQKTVPAPPKPKKTVPIKIDPKKPPAKKTANPTKKTAPTKPKETKSDPVRKEKPVEKKNAPIKKEPTKEEIAAAELKKKKEQEQIALKAHQQQLLSQAQEKIEKIVKTRDKISPNKISEGPAMASVAISSLQIDAVSFGSSQLNEGEMSYRDELAARLKLLLRLPEYGEVKIKLTLERSGKVVNVIVMSAASEANRKHIEKMLPSLTFHPFGSHFSSAQQYTFSITLSNEL